jgi:hypothetical protein
VVLPRRSIDAEPRSCRRRTALLLGNGAVWSSTLWAVLGSGVGFVVAAVVLDTCTANPERDYRKAHGRPPYVTVRQWRDSLVDPDRTLGAPAVPGERPVEAELAESLASHARALRDLL